MINNVEKIVTKLRTKYFVPKDKEFPMIAMHKKLLKELNKYTNLTIIPNNDKQSYSNTDKIPTTKEEFHDQFTVIEENRPRGIVICHSIMTDETIGNLKLKNQGLFNFLKENKIYISQDKSEQKEIVSIGFLTKIHPSIANRDKLNKEQMGQTRSNFKGQG